jgi:DNA-directed RNA polymerase subunit alpha
VWTNGSLTPEKAVQEAAELLIGHVKIFVDQKTEESHSASSAFSEDPELMRKLSRPVEELELSVRAANCLKAANIATIGELVSRSEPEMLQFHNFGKKSLDEIKAILETMGLELGKGSGGEGMEHAPSIAMSMADIDDDAELVDVEADDED